MRVTGAEEGEEVVLSRRGKKGLKFGGGGGRKVGGPWEGERAQERERVEEGEGEGIGEGMREYGE